MNLEAASGAMSRGGNVSCLEGRMAWEVKSIGSESGYGVSMRLCNLLRGCCEN